MILTYLKTILQNPKSDAITKKTAQFMLDKMNEKIRIISKLQEGKKLFFQYNLRRNLEKFF